jgi:hypothetical protein
MANLQPRFQEFHNAIKLGTYDEDATLREKRDLLITNLRAGLAKNDDAPTFTHFNQGSYALNTGIKPKNGDFDIDVGLECNCTPEDYKNPVELKKIVRDALVHPQRTVVIRRPCVTVTYLKDGKPDYHIDLPVYAKREGEGHLQLAMGKENSQEDLKVWERSDPKKLNSIIVDSFDDSKKREQARRIIRYLKVWRDKNLPSGRPISVALTCAVCRWLNPTFDGTTPRDLAALLNLVSIMLGYFVGGWLTINLPVIPNGDLNERMTQAQMDQFKEKLDKLREELIKANDEVVEIEACKILRKVFGDDFPVPEAKEKAHQHKVAGFAVSGAAGV